MAREKLNSFERGLLCLFAGVVIGTVHSRSHSIPIEADFLNCSMRLNYSEDEELRNPKGLVFSVTDDARQRIINLFDNTPLKSLDKVCITETILEDAKCSTEPLDIKRWGYLLERVYEEAERKFPNPNIRYPSSSFSK